MDRDDEIELALIRSRDSFASESISEQNQDPIHKNTPYTVIFQDHEIYIDTKDIRKSTKIKLQYLTLSICFLLFGLSDATIGTIMPSLIKQYDIDHSMASYLFSSQFLGYLTSSLSSNYLVSHYGFQGALLCSQLLSFICFATISFIPPFWVLAAIYVLNGFGAGIMDSAGNLWIGKLDYCNQLLGMMHAVYGLGGMVSPVLITKMVNSGIHWNHYYTLLLSCNVLITVCTLVFFRTETSWKFKYLQSIKLAEHSQEDVSVKEVLSNGLVWFFSLVLFVYVGGELSLGSWIYNYLIVIQHETSSVSSYITSGYWLFMTLGRVTLGFAIGHFFAGRELKAVVICCSLLSVLSLVFTIGYKWVWLQSVSIMGIGYFVGPMFPTIVVVAMTYLPPRLETAGVGMLVAMGGAGAAVIPYLVGYVSKWRPNSGGLAWFPFIMFAVFQFDCVLFVWFWLKKRGSDR